MMCLVVAALMTLVSPQDTPPQDDVAKKLEELTRRVEALEKERTRLLEQIDRLERFGVESAETISKLKKLLQNGETPRPAPVEAPVAEEKPKTQEPTGPTSPVHGKVLIVVADRNFMIVNLGQEDGVRDGWLFEVIRVVKEEGKPARNELLGKAVFEKYVESARATQSKLRITEGDPEKMKYGDSVVANRRMDPIQVADKPADKEPAKPGPRKHRVFGITGDTYMIDAGSQDGLKQSDRVYVYRDKRAIAQLRLDQVGKDYSAGKVIDNTKTAEIAQNDEIYLKDLKTSIVGKVKRIETSGDATGAWIEVGQQQGVKMGMQFEVRRQGKSVGKLKVKSLSNWFSVCEPVAPMTLDDLRTDDFIESVD